MGAELSRALLKERTREVLLYVRFVECSLHKDATIVIPGSPPVPFAKDLTHSLKANTFLLLYNVVEATMTQAIADIHREVKSSNEPLDRLHPKLFLHVLQRFRTGQVGLSETFSVPTGGAIVSYWLEDYERSSNANRNYLFSGNVDGKVICQTGEKYGFASGNKEQDAHLTHWSLQVAKVKRNALAHGETSFRDCGQDVGIEDLRRTAGGLLRCLRRVVATIDQYLTAKRYLRQSA